MVRVLLTILASLALSSCWIGRSLYTSSDARPAIPAGIYRAIAPDEPPRVYRVSILPTGLTQFDSGDKPEVYGFAQLDRNSFIGWAEMEDARPDEDNQFYGLVVREPGGAFMIYPPECKGAEAEIARKSGATVEDGTSPVCRFPTRASLQNAMRRMPRDPTQAMRLERIP